MHKLSGTQIAILTALVHAEESDIVESQEIIACYRDSALKLVHIGMLRQICEARFEPTELGELSLKRELLTRELKRTNEAIAEAFKSEKPSMRALMRFSGIYNKN
ncbi:hypothetical protein [Microbulbifer epialgicus]|uniref:Uncharacterized protein n=1 Tax=Microbulbifer epialgicus TaxID=393907 RepID=A0ABV4NUL0_9GAMM